MAGPFFSPRLEEWFDLNPGDRLLLEPWEIRILQMWTLITHKNIKPWEYDLEYDEDERKIKPEDLADIFKLDQYKANADASRARREAAKQEAEKSGYDTKVLPGAFKKSDTE